MPWIQHTHNEDNKTMDTKYVNEAGSFDGVVEAPEAGWFGEAGEKATPFVRIPIRVSDGRITVWRGYLSENSVDNTVATLTKVFGFDGDWMALKNGTVTFAGMPCNVSTEVEEYKGKETCKAKWLNPPGGSAPKQMDDAKVLSLLAKLTPKSKAIAKATAKMEPKAAAPKQATPDDDVPF